MLSLFYKTDRFCGGLEAYPGTLKSNMEVYQWSYAVGSYANFEDAMISFSDPEADPEGCFRT